MAANNYKGKLGSKYNESLVGYPNFYIFQNAIQGELKKYLKVNKAKKIEVLEAGCGTGVTSCLILESSKRVNLVAVDNSEIVLREAKRKLKKYGRTDFQLLDIEKYLSKEDRKFDIFVQASVLHNLNIAKRKRIIEKAYHALKVGGIFLCADKISQDNLSEHEKSLSWQLEKFKLFEEIGRHDLEKMWKQHYLQDDKIKLSEKEIVAIMKEAGFQKIKKVYRKQMEAIYVGYRLA